MSAVYIGAGLDIIPIIVLTHIKKFIYNDSLPKSEYVTFCFEDERFYNKKFIENLNKVMKNNNFDLLKQNENYLEFYEKDTKDRKVKYFINMPFPENLTDESIEEINNCDTLILSGYCPHKVLIELMPKLNNIIGNTHTVYIHDEYEDEDSKNNSVFEYLKNNPDYEYFLIKEKEKFEYWELENIIPKLKSNFDIISTNFINNFEKLK